MPLFDYKCHDCNVTEQHIIKSSQVNTQEEPLYICPLCSNMLHRVAVCNINFTFNGVAFSSSNK